MKRQVVKFLPHLRERWPKCIFFLIFNLLYNNFPFGSNFVVFVFKVKVMEPVNKIRFL
jgi:hypothetical protein